MSTITSTKNEQPLQSTSKPDSPKEPLKVLSFSEVFNKAKSVLPSSISNSIMTAEIIEAYSDNNLNINEIKIDNNFLAKGFKLFDLNGDNNFDDIEKFFFFGNDNQNISAEELLKKIKRLSEYTDNNEPTDDSKKEVYKITSAIITMFKNLPEHLSEKLKPALERITCIKDSSQNNSGEYSPDIDSIKLPIKNNSKESLASFLTHELTHSVFYGILENNDSERQNVSNTANTNRMAQEIYCSYNQILMIEKMSDEERNELSNALRLMYCCYEEVKEKYKEQNYDKKTLALISYFAYYKPANVQNYANSYGEKVNNVFAKQYDDVFGEYFSSDLMPDKLEEIINSTDIATIQANAKVRYAMMRRSNVQMASW